MSSRKLHHHLLSPRTTDILLVKFPASDFLRSKSLRIPVKLENWCLRLYFHFHCSTECQLVTSRKQPTLLPTVTTIMSNKKEADGISIDKKPMQSLVLERIGIQKNLNKVN